jgi:hypothetical protein
MPSVQKKKKPVNLNVHEHIQAPRKKKIEEKHESTIATIESRKTFSARFP